jgi:hypothetical protein
LKPSPIANLSGRPEPQMNALEFKKRPQKS